MDFKTRWFFPGFLVSVAVFLLSFICTLFTITFDSDMIHETSFEFIDVKDDKSCQGYLQIKDPDPTGEWKNAQYAYDFVVRDIYGNDISLGKKYENKTLLIVNLASIWVFINRTTKEFAKKMDELNQLHELFYDKGLRILGFPSDSVFNKEDGTSKQINDLYVNKYHVKFDLFEKVETNGEDAHPLFKFLKEKKHMFLMRSIKWSFTKFLVDRFGYPVERFSTNIYHRDLIKRIAKYLKDDYSPPVTFETYLHLLSKPMVRL